MKLENNYLYYNYENLDASILDFTVEIRECWWYVSKASKRLDATVKLQILKFSLEILILRQLSYISEKKRQLKI